MDLINDTNRISSGLRLAAVADEEDLIDYFKSQGWEYADRHVVNRDADHNWVQFTFCKRDKAPLTPEEEQWAESVSRYFGSYDGKGAPHCFSFSMAVELDGTVGDTDTFPPRFGKVPTLPETFQGDPGSSIDESGRSWRDRPPLASKRNSIMSGKILTQEEVFEAMDEGDVEILIKMEAHNPQNLRMIRQCLETESGFSEGISLIDSYLQPNQQTPHVPNLPSSIDESGKSWRDRPPLASRIIRWATIGRWDLVRKAAITARNVFKTTSPNRREMAVDYVRNVFKNSPGSLVEGEILDHVMEMFGFDVFGAHKIMEEAMGFRPPPMDEPRSSKVASTSWPFSDLSPAQLTNFATSGQWDQVRKASSMVLVQLKRKRTATVSELKLKELESKFSEFAYGPAEIYEQPGFELLWHDENPPPNEIHILADDPPGWEFVEDDVDGGMIWRSTTTKDVSVPHIPNLPNSVDESGRSWRDRPPLASDSVP